jgi:hypothetical protein
MDESGKFEMKFINIADEVFNEASKNINMKYRPSLFILIKVLENDESEIEVFSVHDPSKIKEDGNVVSIVSYKNKIDLVLFISETESTLTMVYTESDGKSAIKVGVKGKTPNGTIYIEGSSWIFNAPFKQYVSPWNEENSLFIEQMIKDSPPPPSQPMDPEEIVGMAEDLLKSIMGNNCPCDKCRKKRGELVESGDNIHGNTNNILDKLKVPTDKNKIN